MFEQLIANSSNAQSLGDFISSNQLLIGEFVNSSIEAQRRQEDLFQQFVLLNSRVQIMNALDFTKSTNRAFIAFLFDYAERVNAVAAAVQLYQIIQKHNLGVGSRLEATMLYLYNVPNNQVYVDLTSALLTTLGHIKDYRCIMEYGPRALEIEPGILTAYYWIIIAADETGNSMAREKFLQKAAEDLIDEENEKLMKLLALQNHMS